LLESRSRVAKDGNTGAANLVEDSEECGNTAVAEAAEGTIKEDIAVREEEEAITCSRPKSPVTKHPTPSRESLTLKQNPKREGNKNQETPSFKITAETNKFLRKNTAPTHRCHTKNPETKVRTQTRARERARPRREGRRKRRNFMASAGSPEKDNVLHPRGQQDYGWMDRQKCLHG
jgi:hypothetical protein